MDLVGDEVILHDTRDRSRHAPQLAIKDQQGNPIITVEGDKTLALPSGVEAPQTISWPRFLAWRKTKCRPFATNTEPYYAVEHPFHDALNPNRHFYVDYDDHAQHDPLTFVRRMRALEEIDQAICEFIGETAELSELFLNNGMSTFYLDKRAKLLDECGDILFCGAWALDAWGQNPLYNAGEVDDVEFIRVADGDEAAIAAQMLQSSDGPMPAMRSDIAALIQGIVMSSITKLLTNAALLANSYKKLRFQRRKQDVSLQSERIMYSLMAVNEILILANSNVEEALTYNVAKLDARYPQGYQPGQGGGIRTPTP